MESLWIKTVKTLLEDSKNLEGENECDICIIGGGITGITTAYYLSKAGKKVILLEREKLSIKATGNTTAKITSQHGLFYKYLIDNYGKEYAKKYYEANQEAIENIAQIIKDENIKCDFERQDSYVFTRSEQEIDKLKDEVQAVKDIGGDAEFVTTIEPNIKSVLGAVKFPNQAMFNVRKYLKGLVNVIIQHDGEIYEETKAYSVKSDANGYIVYVENGGIVKAKQVVIATHYPIINIPGFYFLKMYQEASYVIGIKTDHKLFQGMYINSESPTISLRIAKDEDKNIVLIGGMEHRVGAKIDLDNAYKNLERIAKEIFDDEEVIYKWNTQDCITLDKIPYIGEFSGMMKGVYVATGYKKWGMTTSNIAANIIKDKILNNENKCEELFKSTRLEPIKNRWEFGEMIKETTNSLIINKFKEPEESLKDIKCGEGKIIKIENEKVGVYRDEEGKIYSIKPVCAHLGCELSWNNLEKTWDCPCHGSRFDYKGKQIYGPAINDLEIKLD